MSINCHAEAFLYVDCKDIAITHKNNERSKPSLTETLPEAIGLLFVLSTLISNFLSTISFIIQPAERIRTEPKKNKIK